MKLTIEKAKDGFIINNKYFIDFRGVIWYDNRYIGRREKDYPQYLFALSKLIKENTK